MASLGALAGGLLSGVGEGMVSQAEARRQEGLERAREFRRQLERQEDRAFQTERDEAQRTFQSERDRIQNEQAISLRKEEREFQKSRDEAQHKNRLGEISATGAEARKAASYKTRGGFRMLSKDEIKAAGLPEGTSAQIDEVTGKIDVVNKPASGGGLPVGALKIVDEAKQSLGAANESAALINQTTDLLRSGKVKLGLVQNLEARGRNLMGGSTAQSRAYADIRQTLEKLRNNYLLLAKGVQTEGDATRAWNSEVGESAQNDNKLALQQMEKARLMIGRMLQMQQDRIDTVYENYGATQPKNSSPEVDEADAASGWSIKSTDDNTGGWSIRPVQ